MTEGGSGGTYATGGEERRFDAAPVPGPKVDAYGCGDAFAAGLTYGLATELPVEEAVTLAAQCGAATLTGRGPYDAPLPVPPG
jgi:ribokinase